MQNQKLRAICEGAVSVAMAYALSFLKVKFLGEGGSISLVMIPLILYAVRWGVSWGVGAGLVFGTLKCFFAGGFAWGWASILLDYSVAYACVGLAGLFQGRKYGLPIGAAVGAAARFAIHFISGITIYAIVAPTELFSATYTSPWMYSLIYNGSYMLVNLALAVVICALLMKPLDRFMNMKK